MNQVKTLAALSIPNLWHWVQLSDSSEYEGGDFELWTGGGFKSLPKIKGCCVLFPSFLLHRVTPVTQGTRKTLVLWIGGGNYK